jgi:hypothetical protein
MLFYEFLALEHPLASARSIGEVLALLTKPELPLSQWMQRATMSRGAPAELLHIVIKGLARDREQRYRSVAALEGRIRSVISGTMAIQCHVTLAKRAASMFAHWVDRHALLYTVIFLASTLGVLAGLVTLIVKLVSGVT